MMDTIFTDVDRAWMQRAILLAEKAREMGEVPVGAVLVREGICIGEGYNQPIATRDPTAHAEVIALRAAAQTQKNYRVPDTTLYVTLEPCLMCVGAIVHARVKRVIFGAHDPRTGVAESQGDFFSLPFLNHRIRVAGGLLADLCGELLTTFFKARR